MLLCNTPTAGLCHCKYTCEHLLLTQICSDPTARHWNTVQNQMQFPLVTAAVQNTLTAGFYHCKYTHKHLMYAKMCKDPKPGQCSNVHGQIQCPLVNDQKRNIAVKLCKLVKVGHNTLFILVHEQILQPHVVLLESISRGSQQASVRSGRECCGDFAESFATVVVAIFY